MGDRIKAYILLTVEVGKEHEIADEIGKLDKDAVVEADVVYGEYDVVVRLETSSLRVIDRIVTSIRSMPGVLRSVTLIAS